MVRLRVAIGSDHAGFAWKKKLVAELRKKGYTVADLGTDSSVPIDYPDIAEVIAGEILSGRADRGLLICGSGVGVSVAANKFAGIRAGVCHDTYSAHQAVEHDDINVLCVGARVVGYELVREIVLTFLDAKFSAEERHRRRLEKIEEIEKKQMKERIR